MSSSFVPKIKMSKGTSKKTKFDISCNTHTTSEVGYLQPVFSKILMPNSDLTIRSNDNVLMSSLVVPTFGKLSLRYWYMATPVSSLWTPLGSFLSGRACVDRDDSRGFSVPYQMPRTSMLSLLYHTIFYSSRTVTQLDPSYNNTPDRLAGNLTYAFHRHGSVKSASLLSFDDFLPSNFRRDISATQWTASGWMVDSALTSSFNNTFHATKFRQTIGYEGDDITYQFVYDSTDNFKSKAKRFTSVFPWWQTGLVIKNTDSLRKMLTKKTALASAQNFGVSEYTEFPTPDDCPYVVVFCRTPIYSVLTTDSYDLGHENHSLVSGQTYQGGFEFIPLTMRMYQGDIHPDLYRLGWRNDSQNLTYNPKGTADNVFRYTATHPTGQSLGWSLMSDDSYFTGNLGTTTFDYCAVQPWQIPTAQTLTNDQIRFYACGNWSRRFKRLRKLFVGFGQQFNPFDMSEFTLWKIMSYYKSWFDNFHPKRDMQYYQTPLARFSNFLSYHSSVWHDDLFDALLHVVSYSGPHDTPHASQVPVSDLKNVSEFRDFVTMLFDCADAKYLMPLDYFTLADPNPLESNSDFLSQDNFLDAKTSVKTTDSMSLPSKDDVNIEGGVMNMANLTENNTLNAWALKMADKMLSYLTKRRVVGKSVSDTMRALFGAVDEHDKAHESTWCFGTSSTDLKISAVMSQAETEEMHLGDFAGRGLGGSTSRSFKIENNADLLVVIVMSAIVPRLGYYQGNFRENNIGTSPNDFCKTIYDAVGYDDVNADEYIADVLHYDDNTAINLRPENRTMYDINDHILGLVPRYTWYKVARDVVNGDMSLPSTKDSMSPYVMTRDVDKGFSCDPLEMRTVDPDSFNKIFNESSSLDDHFIIQIGFDVDCFAPLKSLSTSFDDFDQDEDGTIEVEHS